MDGQYYVSQHRERIIVGFDKLCYRDDFSFDLSYPEHKPVVSDILEEQVDAKYTLSDKL